MLALATRDTSAAVQSGSQQQLASHFFAFRLHTQEQSNFVQGFELSTQLQPGGGLSMDVDEELRGEINDHIGYCAATRGKNNNTTVKATKTTKRIVKYNKRWVECC